MEKKYTEEDLIEIEKIHRESYKQIHNLVRNVFDISTENNVKKHLIKIMELVYSKEVFCQKDIQISESAAKQNSLQ